MATYWENSCSFGLRYVSWYKYLIVSLVFSHLGFWSGNLFLIAPFPDLCLLVPFYYNGSELSIVNSFSYFGVVFTPGGASSSAQQTLAGQAQKAIFRLNSYLYMFTDISPYHRLELFNKLVTPILNYSAEVWGFCKADEIEVVHLQFCKRLLGLKQCTQNDFVYGDFGRCSFHCRILFIIIRYWLKVITCNENKYIKHNIYNMMLSDIESMTESENWAMLVKRLLCVLGFNNV